MLWAWRSACPRSSIIDLSSAAPSRIRSACCEKKSKNRPSCGIRRANIWTPLVCSRPLQALADGATHHPVLVALRQEPQLFGEVGDALAVACLRERVRDVGSPIAALRTVGVEYALQVHCHVAERIKFERIA